ncbi:MAG: hypothetical protein WD424_09810 [Paenibacillaceae bacterium]
MFKEQYPKIYLLDKNNQFKSHKVKEILSNITMSLWFAGYGLFQGYGIKTVSNVVLEEILKHQIARKSGTRAKKMCNSTSGIFRFFKAGYIYKLLNLTQCMSLPYYVLQRYLK